MKKARIKEVYSRLVREMDAAQEQGIRDIEKQIAEGKEVSEKRLYRIRKPWREWDGIEKRIRKKAKKIAYESRQRRSM